jgi:AraC-like DNA-binding protein
MSTPLENRPTFSTQDPDEAREVVSRAFCAHRLDLIDGHLEMRTRAAALPRMSLHYLDYGATVRISPDPLTSFYLLQVPIAGTATASTRGIEVLSGPDVATLLDPDDRATMVWDAGTPHLCLRIDRTALETKATRLIGRTLRSPLHFEFGVALTTPAGRSMRHYLDLLSTELEEDGMLAERSLVTEQLEDLVMTSLLLSAPSTYSTWFEQEDGTATPRAIRRAMDLIEEHAHEPLTVEDIAEAVGTSVRALQSGFRRHVGSSPLTYLRDVRLELVHEALRAADPSRGLCVTDLALDHGFAHLGRFAQAYRERFGVAPSDTLRS